MKYTFSDIFDWQQILGIDEAGRGALAGPLVAAAVCLTFPYSRIAQISGIKPKDSKLLSPQKREKIYKLLCELNTEIKVATISTLQINHHGIGWANREIFRKLIKGTDASHYIVDGNLEIGFIYGKTNRIYSVIDADALVSPVILAGIVAKVIRDKMMRELDKEFPVYDWHKNAGYGTPGHINAIKSNGISRYHRLVFVHTALQNKAK